MKGRRANFKVAQGSAVTFTNDDLPYISSILYTLVKCTWVRT